MRVRMRLSLFFLNLLLVCPILQAQNTNLKFENISTAEGLSSSTCTEIFQDSQGFLWFGTIDGLNKYNGYEFKIYRPEVDNPFSISNNRINSIVEDGDGYLWIGTNNGLNVFDSQKEQFIRIQFYQDSSPTVSPSETINELLYDQETNRLWIGTKNGLFKLSLDGLARNRFSGLDFEHYRNKHRDSTSIDSDNVVSLVKDNDNNIWAATDGRNLNKYNPETDDFRRLLIDVDADFELEQLPKQVLVDSENNFWIGNNLSDLVYWEQGENDFEQYSLVEEDIAVFDLYQDDSGLLWIATDGHGIYLFDKKTGSLQHLEQNPEDPFSLPNNQISQVFEDSQGIFWIATYNKGVSKQAPAKSSFGHYFYQYGSRTGLSTKIAQSVLQDSKGRIWIGTDGGGLNLFNEEEGNFTHYRADSGDPNSISSDKILYLAESFDGDIWIGTWDGGLSKFDPEREKAKNYQSNSTHPYALGQNTVWTVEEDSMGRLWVGTQTEGLNLFDPETERFHKYKNLAGDPNTLISDFVFSLFRDSRERLLVGTAAGLCYVELKSLQEKIPAEIAFHEVEHENIRGNRINYITEDHQGNIWVGTDIGLYKLNPELELLHSYSSRNGLPNNLVVGIAEDDRGNLWVTTKSGLSVLNPDTHTFKNYDVHDGLQGTEFQSKSIDKTLDGRIIAGGINGFNIFDPDDIIISAGSVRPIITSLKLSNNIIKVGDTVNGRVLLEQPITEIDKLKLRHDETYLAFDFVGLHYQNPGRIEYRYRLKGLDENFVSAGDNRSANYSNLTPGTYTFEVQASVDDQWDVAESSIVSLEVLPPPWLTWWAYLLYFILIAGILWFVFWYYTRKVKEEKEHELDQMKLRFFMNVSHEFRTPLTLILNPVDKILATYSDPEEVQRSAVTIQRSARRLLYLVNQLLDFRKMDMGKTPLNLVKSDIVKFSKDIFILFRDLAEAKNIKFKFHSSVKEYEMHFDSDKYEKIITNLISNALKFTGKGGKVKMSIGIVRKDDQLGKKLFSRKKTEEYLEIKVTDTGVGFKKEQLNAVFSRFFHVDDTKTGTGIGLNFTKALVELHGGQIHVESEFNKGSEFVVQLPVTPVKRPEGDQVGSFPTPLDSQVDINTVKSAEYEIFASGDIDESKAENESDCNDKKPVLLIVEDNRELRTHLRNELGDDFVIKEAKNGVIGLEKVNKYFPDLVISDVMMPEMDGFQLCRAMKTNEETCHIPIILLTARSLEEDQIEGYETGADEYLPKPFNIHILRARVKNLLEAKQRLREKFTSIAGVAPSSEFTTNSLDEAFLDKATKIVVDNMSNPDFTLEDIIREIGVGRSQFYRKINSISGQNPSTFIRTIKLKFASELLLHNKYSIKEITHMTGFNSSAYFSKTFKELYGLTPSQYIRQQNSSRKKEQV